MKSGISKIMAVLATMLAFSSCEKEKSCFRSAVTTVPYA